MLKLSVPWDRQPPIGTPLDKANPFVKSLVFCAVPLGKTFIDLVTGVIGTPNGTTSNAIRSENGGKSRKAAAGVATHGNGAATDYIIWPVSDKLRGATINEAGTVLCLGGTTEQVDGKFYEFGGNFELSNGYGVGLGIDSYLHSARGPILITTYSGNARTSSYPNSPLGTNDFGNKTHFFGFSFSGNGASGSFFGNRSGFGWTGGGTYPSVTSGRQACVLQPSMVGVYSSATYVQLFLMWDRPLSLAEYQALYDNPWQIFEPERIYIPVDTVAAPQLLAPIADLSAGGWTPSSGSDIYAMLDESTASDTDYIVSSTASSCEMRLAVGGDPAVSTGHILRYRLLSGTGSITAILKQGSTTIASFGPHTLTGSAQDFAQTLSAGQADSISDYSDLRVVFTAS